MLARRRTNDQTLRKENSSQLEERTSFYPEMKDDVFVVVSEMFGGNVKVKSIV